MSDPPEYRIGPCTPADPARLEALLAQLRITLPPGVVPVPLVDDTHMVCPACEMGMWVGPRKKAMADAGLVRLLCFVCFIAFAVAEAPELLSLPVVNLGPGREERPRRARGDSVNGGS